LNYRTSITELVVAIDSLTAPFQGGEGEERTESYLYVNPS